MDTATARDQIEPRIDSSWKSVLSEEFRQPYFIDLKHFLVEERDQGHTLFPPGSLIFNAFNRTPFESVRVVIMGQDPYHGPGQANGLCFSVSPGIRIPPSLANIFKELKQDLGCPISLSGNLEPWADQGVLLLNASLSVRAHTPNSHAGRGWEQFTDAAIRALSENREGLVFLLWGRNAQAKESLVDTSRHLVLKAAHPSPYSANGFFGCRHFSKANKWLEEKGMGSVDWRLQGHQAT